MEMILKISYLSIGIGPLIYYFFKGKNKKTNSKPNRKMQILLCSISFLIILLTIYGTFSN
ncbi:hypothetical protein GCM10007380_08120 [Gottfriedia solisilvae]|uniref:Uncharacterized protein n=1 Tax=Gottfriedia solisilvae TaxID=1516104 RepID=A0A8J3ACS8_9BACI|nr:hypothetical protein GCM10007380_08120 [Gottfriedia solisilvae]